jgi:hypothetical protein
MVRVIVAAIFLSCFPISSFAQNPACSGDDNAAGQAGYKKSDAQGQGSREASGCGASRSLQAWRDFGGR